MPDSSERGFNMFSAPARRVFETAQEEAKRFNQRYITAEHLLLALLGEKEGVVAQVFTNLKVDVREMRTALEFSINREATPGDRPPSLGPRAKKAIRLAVDEARLTELNRVSTPTKLPSTEFATRHRSSKPVRNAHAARAEPTTKRSAPQCSTAWVSTSPNSPPTAN